MANEKQRESDFDGFSLEVVCRGITNLQQDLSKLSHQQIMQELETIKMWLINKDERNTNRVD
jgi:hypothetical protein